MAAKYVSVIFAVIAMFLIFSGGALSIYKLVIEPKAKLELEIQKAKNDEIRLKHESLKDIMQRGKDRYRDQQGG